MNKHLDNIRSKVVADYRDKAELRFSEYESTGSEHCKIFLDYLVKPPAKILDIGSGSGRDAAYYTKLGYQVTAIEPAKELRELAQQKIIT